MEAAKGNISDMSGLMNDVMALAKADLAKLSDALTLMDSFAGATECTYGAISGYPYADGFLADIVLEGIAANINSLLDAWWENATILEQLQERVRRSPLAHLRIST